MDRTRAATPGPRLHRRAARGRPLRELDAAEAAARTGSPVHLGGLFDPSVAAVQPARLTLALRDAAVASGVVVLERTAVRSIGAAEPPGGSTAIRLEIDAGTVRAEQVVLAINAWAAAVPELARGLVVVACDVVATAAIPDRLDRLGLTEQLTISDSRRLVNYYRRTPDGRLLFGRGGGTLGFANRVGASMDAPGGRERGVHSQLVRIYPQLHDVAITHRWSGAVDDSLTGVPFFVRLTGPRTSTWRPRAARRLAALDPTGGGHAE